MTNLDNIKRIDFELGYRKSDGNLIKGTYTTIQTVLWNETVISSDEVMRLIETGNYENDNRLIVTTPDRADALNGKYKKK